jgi:hypothetical protein
VGNNKIKYCVWCGKKTKRDKMILPDTPILEEMEDKIDHYGRRMIWGEYSDWSRLDLDSDFEAELLVYDQLLATSSPKTVCKQCLDEDERLWDKYYGSDEVMFDE